VPAPAPAEVGAVISAYSDLRYRGVSLSDGRPVGILDLSYDASNGLYAALSGSIVASNEGLRPLGLTLNGGYARPIGRGLSADVGFVHWHYSHYSEVPTGRAYSELYAGISAKNVGTRFSLSPNYVGQSRWTLHGEINGHADLTPNLYLDGELGALFPLGNYGTTRHVRPIWDARVGLAQRVGRISLHAAVSARGKRSDVYGSWGRRRVGVILGISTAL